MTPATNQLYLYIHAMETGGALGAV